MPAPAPFSSPHSQAVYPALYLYPLNDSFVPKHIALLHNQHVKIGRQTNAKTVPGERNGYFDSKVLSRQHAEVWEEGNKIFIKDVKSSNGTFINGERLSPEGLESEPYELKSDDIVEFGIDIVGEDNKTTIHHKVSARVVCVFTEQDAQVAARAEQHQQQAIQQQSSTGIMSIQPGPSSSSSFNFASNQSGTGAQRRPQMQQQGLTGMGGMGGSMRPPGKSGLTFDHILSRLQGELQKSRETGTELHTLTGAMNDIHDTLGGSLPQNLPPYPHTLPPVRLSQQSSTNEPPANTNGSPETSEQPSIPSSSALSEIQAQLQDTQSNLNNHVEKIRALEEALNDREAIKREVNRLRDLMESRARDINQAHAELEPRGGFELDADSEEERMARGVGGDDDIDDDTRSINTVVPHELERVEEEDEDQLALAAEEDLEHEGEGEEAEEEEAEEDRRRRREELGRPRTPEPTGMGMAIHGVDDFDTRSILAAPRRHSTSPTSTSPTSSFTTSLAIQTSHVTSNLIGELTSRLTALTAQLESALSLSSTLQAQHIAAQSTISTLQSKVEALEDLVKTKQAAAAPVASFPDSRPPEGTKREEKESLTQILNDWKKGMEGQWSNIQEEWNQERERLAQAREEWEGKVKLVDSSLVALQSQNHIHPSRTGLPNGDCKHNGLVTPPSPRSLSSDSNRPRMRKRKSGSSRGRSGSRSRSPGVSSTTAAEDLLSKFDPGMSPTSQTFSPDVGKMEGRGERSLATPEPSLHAMSSSTDSVQVGASAASSIVSSTEGDPTQQGAGLGDLHPMNVQTAVGVLVLSVAAAAVIWRVKPE